MLKNPIAKNILSAVAIVVFGFMLLNLAFIFDFLVHSLVIGLIGVFTPVDLTMNFQWLPPAMHGLFAVIIGVISWHVFQSKLSLLFKAIYMTVPLAVVFATIGIFLYPWPIAAYMTGGLFGVGILYYFYRTKQPWLYYYTVILVGSVMLMAGLLGVEI